MVKEGRVWKQISNDAAAEKHHVCHVQHFNCKIIPVIFKHFIVRVDVRQNWALSEDGVHYGGVVGVCRQTFVAGDLVRGQEEQR